MAVHAEQLRGEAGVLETVVAAEAALNWFRRTFTLSEIFCWSSWGTACISAPSVRDDDKELGCEEISSGAVPMVILSG